MYEPPIFDPCLFGDLCRCPVEMSGAITARENALGVLGKGRSPSWLALRTCSHLTGLRREGSFATNYPVPWPWLRTAFDVEQRLFWLRDAVRQHMIDKEMSRWRRSLNMPTVPR